MIYVDGFNLYYSALKGRETGFKWLSLHGLFSKVLKPDNAIVGIRYFTARVSGTGNDPSKPHRQEAYIRALRATTPNLSIHFGQFKERTHRGKLVDPLIPNVRMATIASPTEKGSDVNLAVHLLNDAWLDKFDCAVIVSRDSDLAESMSLIREHHPAKVLGLIGVQGKHMPKELKSYAHFERHIMPGHLKASQLPSPVPGTSIVRPAGW
jgi:uncharacterized LabA/DUF88 family protein